MTYINVNIPKTDNLTLNTLVKEYLELKTHEFKSIISKISTNNCYFKSTYKKNKYLNYSDLHLTLKYNYKNYEIREDKYYHTLNDNIIDIMHFTRNKENLIDYLKEELQNKLKKYKITEDMINLVLLNNSENYLIKEESLIFIYPLTMFGLKSDDEINIKVGYKVLKND